MGTAFRAGGAERMGTAFRAGGAEGMDTTAMAGAVASAQVTVKIDPPSAKMPLQDKMITAGDNEGTTKLTAIHFLCGTKLYASPQEKAKVSRSR